MYSRWKYQGASAHPLTFSFDCPIQTLAGARRTQSSRRALTMEPSAFGTLTDVSRRGFCGDTAPTSSASIGIRPRVSWPPAAKTTSNHSSSGVPSPANASPLSTHIKGTRSPGCERPILSITGEAFRCRICHIKSFH